MKTKHLTLFLGLILLINMNGAAQVNSKFKEIRIMTSAQCEQCKERIEEALAFEKGIKSAELNLEDKIVTVIYNPAKTNPDKIRDIISKTGYDADGMNADPEAYKKLPACCKKPEK